MVTVAGSQATCIKTLVCVFRSSRIINHRMFRREPSSAIVKHSNEQ